MKYISDKTQSASFHHALERYLLDYVDDDVFMLWQNTPVVLIGRNQNIYREVNLKYCHDHNIEVIRRLSGGGAIYNDLLSFQYSFIAKEKEGPSFQYFAQPVLKALADLGIEAEFSGRNDLLYQGKKISGNAQFHYQNKVLHHGTILFDTHPEHLYHALIPNPAKYKKKNVDSVQSRVTVLKDIVPYSVQEFMALMIERIRYYSGAEEKMTLTDGDLRKIESIRKNVFENPDWNYGENRDNNLNYDRLHDYGIIEYGLEIEHGVIKDIAISGDFFGQKAIEELENHLKNVPLIAAELEKKIAEIDPNVYILNMTQEDLLSDLLAER